MGTIEVFRGLSQINPDSMKVLATGRPIKDPIIANAINESLESDLVRINGVQLVNPANWTTGVGTGGFTVKVFKGTDTTDVRIDNDCPLYNQPAPTGTFDLIGMGGQFSPTTSAPFVGGYQLVPRKNSDLITAPQTLKPIVNFLTSSGSYLEDDSTYTYSTIQASATPTADFQPYIFVKGGSATKGLDYPNIAGTQYSMGPGQLTNIQTSIGILDDLLPEPNETITLVLRKAGLPGDTNYVIGPDSVFTFTILDNDNPTSGVPFTRTIAQLRGANSGNQADSVGRNIRVFGTVYGVNQRLTSTGGGYQMFIRDATGGIGIFKTTSVSGITTLNEGDSIKVMGKVEVFRGLSQINPDSMKILATGRPIKNPEIVDKLNENLESDLVRINGVQLVNSSAWTTGTGAGGFTIKVFKGTDTTDVRIDNDCPLYNQPAPTGTFDIIGMGSQFVPGTPTPVAPFPASGYQLIPRRLGDLIPNPSPLEKPVLRFTSTGLSFTESNGTQVAPISLSGPPPNNTTIQVGMVVKGGTATFLSDYGSQGAFTIFEPGSVLTNQLPVEFLDDL
ncbi:MAG TPA: Calx-beta domain-containing protein, partial [Catalimonadaceae bacterium]|nr:Calx-beta domain-containing protein [Catalimonadaceae bacterium]